MVATFEKYDRVALPVTDSRGVLVGMITVDDVLDVAEQEATEDIQASAAWRPSRPPTSTALVSMVWKRGGWLSALFLGEMLTATAMSAFEDEIAKAVVLSLFLPLIICCGGNSGSQAASIIIRSLALREGAADWWRWRAGRSRRASRWDASWGSSVSFASSSGRRGSTSTASTTPGRWTNASLFVEQSTPKWNPDGHLAVSVADEPVTSFDVVALPCSCSRTVITPARSWAVTSIATASPVDVTRLRPWGADSR